MAVMSEVRIGRRNEFRNREMCFCFRLCRMCYIPVANGHIQSLCDSIAPKCLTAAFSTHSRNTVVYSTKISFRNEKSRSNIRTKNIGRHILLSDRCSNFDQVMLKRLFPRLQQRVFVYSWQGRSVIQDLVHQAIASEKCCINWMFKI
jgi:hypothetical protein